jgi:hypothetical protein
MNAKYQNSLKIITAEGKFGQECKQTCTCQTTGTQTCQATDGTCVCKPGYKGAKCESRKYLFIKVWACFTWYCKER